MSTETYRQKVEKSDSYDFGKVLHYTMTAIYGNPKTGMQSLLNADKGREVLGTIEDQQNRRNLYDIP